MTTSLWTVARTGDSLATDDAVPIARARQSMVEAAADLTLVEVRAVFGSRVTVTCHHAGWVLVTNTAPADAVLAASLADWTEGLPFSAAVQH